MTDIETARRAHAEVVQRQAQAAEHDGNARAAIAEAIAAKERLFASVAAGDHVTTPQLREAEDKVRTAEIDAMSAGGLLASIKTASDRAEVALLAAQASAARATVFSAVEENMEAARLADEAVQAARVALDRLHAAAVATAEATRAAAQHDLTLPQIARRNAIMAEQHSSMWPKTRVGCLGDPVALLIEVVRPAGLPTQRTGHLIGAPLVEVQRADLRDLRIDQAA